MSRRYESIWQTQTAYLDRWIDSYQSAFSQYQCLYTPEARRDTAFAINTAKAVTGTLKEAAGPQGEITVGNTRFGMKYLPFERPFEDGNRGNLLIYPAGENQPLHQHFLETMARRYGNVLLDLRENVLSTDSKYRKSSHS